MNEKFMDELIKYLVNKYSCHSIILYGSYTTADYTAESDIDVLCFCDEVGARNDTTILHDKQLDAWIYNTKEMENTEKFLHVKDGLVLYDQRGLCNHFLDQIIKRYDKGPEPLNDNEKQFLKNWLLKMMKRSQKGDIEGDFRYHWMLTDSLEIYFKLRGLWYMGPKKSLIWLSHNDKYTYNLYKCALNRQATVSDVEALINHIVTL